MMQQLINNPQKMAKSKTFNSYVSIIYIKQLGLFALYDGSILNQIDMRIDDWLVE